MPARGGGPPGRQVQREAVRAGQELPRRGQRQGMAAPACHNTRLSTPAVSGLSRQGSSLIHLFRAYGPLSTRFACFYRVQWVCLGTACRSGVGGRAWRLSAVLSTCVRADHQQRAHGGLRGGGRVPRAELGGQRRRPPAGAGLPQGLLREPHRPAATHMDYQRLCIREETRGLCCVGLLGC